MGEGGFLWLLNGTVYDWVLKSQHQYQMNSWSFPSTVPAGGNIRIYIEWDQHIGHHQNDDGGEAQFSIGSTGHTFQIQARATPGFHLQAVLDNFSTDNHPSGSTIPLGWRHDGEVVWMLSGKEGSYTSSAPPSNWMQANLATLGNRTLRQLCLPASHDSGMSKITGGTAFANARNTQTQVLSIHDQLVAGCRYFDIRPVITAGKFAAGHYSEIDALHGWQGGNGEYLTDMIAGINSFTATNKELIILELSHAYDTDAGHSNYPPLNQDQWNRLLQQLSGIDNLFICTDPVKSQDLTTLPLKSFISNNAAVVCIAEPDGNVTLGSYANHGFFTSSQVPIVNCPSWGQYDPTEDAGAMSKYCLDSLRKNRTSPTSAPGCLSWCLTQSTEDAILCALGLPGNSILDLAVRMPPHTHSDIWAASSAQTYPNFIKVDAFDSDVTVLSIAISKYFAKDP